MDYLLRSVVRVYFLFGALTHQEINSSKTQQHYCVKFWQLGVLWCCIKPILVKQHFFGRWRFLHCKGPPASFSLHCCKCNILHQYTQLISYFPCVKSTLQKSWNPWTLLIPSLNDAQSCFDVLEVNWCICGVCSHSLRWTQHTSSEIKCIAGIHCQT